MRRRGETAGQEDLKDPPEFQFPPSETATLEMTQGMLHADKAVSREVGHFGHQQLLSINDGQNTCPMGKTVKSGKNSEWDLDDDDHPTLTDKATGERIVRNVEHDLPIYNEKVGPDRRGQNWWVKQGVGMALMATLTATGENLDAATESLRAVLARIEQGEGTLGRLSTDESLYVSLNEAAESLNSLLADLQENPNKYINISIF